MPSEAHQLDGWAFCIGGDEERSVSMSEATFVPLCQAAVSLGVSRPTLRKLIGTGAVTVYTSQLDGRKKLLAAADLARLAIPQARERLVA
jgi:hypothetical protein